MVYDKKAMNMTQFKPFSWAEGFQWLHFFDKNLSK